MAVTFVANGPCIMLQFLREACELESRGECDGAIDLIYEHMNNLLVEGKFEACDQILDGIDVAEIPIVLMVSLLTITAAAKLQLKNRNKFYKRVEQAVVKERGEEGARRLLDGLE